MKKIIFLITMALMSSLQSLHAQEGLKENFNIKVGVLGCWVAYEKPLSDAFLLNAEIGYTGGILNSELIFTSTIALEPRYYYNINKRIKKDKNIEHNSANYFALQLSYVPDILTVTKNNINVVKTFGLVPTYGLRRNISGGFNFDFEFGVGYLWSKELENEVTSNLFIGFSYVF